jgi:RsiW-degrading membrane proteinase PrsW (M82 family)
MWLGTGLALLAEVALAVVTVLAVGAYVMLNPGLLSSLRQFAHDLSAVDGVTDALTVLRPWLDRPWVFFSALLVFAGIIPVIEEGAKSVGIWAIADRLAPPGDGLVAGALSGAGFGLIEGLFASATPDPFWAVTLAIRGGSTMMHIAAASVAGYGIVAFRRTHRVPNLLRGYAGAVALHGLWNASVVIMGFGGMHVATGLSDPNWLGLFLIAVGSAILVALCVATPFGLFALNRRLQPIALVSQPRPALEPMGITSPAPPTSGDER